MNINRKHRSQFQHSLLVRIAVILVLLVIITTAILFFGLEHFISKQFYEFQIERQNRFSELVQKTVIDEQQKLQGITQLLVNDTELRNSTYYHLYLAGEERHPQTAVKRMANAFNLESISLWNDSWQLIAAYNSADIPFISSEGNHIVSYKNNAWIVATVQMERDSMLLAYLQIARPLEQLLYQRFGSDNKILIITSKSSPIEKGALRISIDERNHIFIDIIVSDPVEEALTKVKYLLFTVLLIAGIMMPLVFVFFLRWQLKPLLRLHKAAETLGKGDFSVHIQAQGSLEMVDLITAFNRMAERLRKMQAMQQKIQHQEKLSSVGRVAARVAHNINNPLTVILNLARLMQGQKDEQQNSEDLKAIIHNSKRAVNTVEQLLYFSRPLQLRQENKKLSTLCRKIAQQWSLLHNSASLKYINTEDDAIVYIDPLQFEEALENLLDNAYDASSEREILLEFWHSDKKAGLKVKDKGTGFTQEAKRHAFEPFFTTKTSGNGLGLASAQAIIRAHGGDLVIEGNQSHGELNLHFPLR